MCNTEQSRTKVLRAEDVLAKLNSGGYTVRGKSLTLKTAHLLLIFKDADKTGDLDVVEWFKLEHYVAVVRREYVESYESSNPTSDTQTQMKKALAAHDFDLDEETFKFLWLEYRSQGGIEYNDYVAALTRLHILKDRFQAHLLNLPCDCRVARFSFKQFMKSAII
ncbi:penta-EF hand domain-containing protein 1-like [Odontesthes bonariensis]|uniref:penta-EF hand domain-containing protein 1-like n=1 Tax=Odontesthes bonariensis TaxID=219752 RepID=UPI003F584D69